MRLFCIEEQYHQSYHGRTFVSDFKSETHTMSHNLWIGPKLQTKVTMRQIQYFLVKFFTISRHVTLELYPLILIIIFSLDMQINNTGLGMR